jgi:hypothetical protein
LSSEARRFDVASQSSNVSAKIKKLGLPSSWYQRTVLCDFIKIPSISDPNILHNTGFLE